VKSGESIGGVRDLVRGLLDFEFQTVVTTQLLPIVYRVVVTAIAIGVVWQVAEAFAVSWLRGVLWLTILGPAVFLGMVTAVRVFLEFVISIFRVAVHVEFVSRRMIDIADQTEEIAADLPRIQFWRWGRRREERAPEPDPNRPGPR
jgi:hypothetical protein